ncbi:MAG: succinate dehydrogenase/fumarate reductase iron-sulfur subunit [Myxococcota bacterium]|nr:succinate dehydrogenase/fumarate reductase iron-sulfur subunit [Myxococcota bacterium]
MNLTLKVWRQTGQGQGSFETYEAKDISSDASFLEMLDVVNDQLESEGKEPIAFDHDCREGICGACGFLVNGVAHGPETGTTICQTHMRKFKDGETLTVEPWRAKAFPVIKDLMVDRTAFDKIIQSGGYISVRTGSAPDAHTMPINKAESDMSFDAAACIGCGACVAACPNAAAMLFTSAKVSHLGLTPQGEVERLERASAMVDTMEEEGFGACTNHGECEAVCPKEISVNFIARLNRDLMVAKLKGL